MHGKHHEVILLGIIFNNHLNRQYSCIKYKNISVFCSRFNFVHPLLKSKICLKIIIISMYL